MLELTRPNSVSARRCPSVTAHSAAGPDGSGSPAITAGWPGRACPARPAAAASPAAVDQHGLADRQGGRRARGPRAGRPPGRARPPGSCGSRRLLAQAACEAGGCPVWAPADQRAERGDPAEPGQGQGLVDQRRGRVAELPRVQVVADHDVADAGPVQVRGQAGDLLAGFDAFSAVSGGPATRRRRRAPGRARPTASWPAPRAGRRSDRPTGSRRARPRAPPGRVLRRVGGQEGGGLIPVLRHRGERAGIQDLAGQVRQRQPDQHDAGDGPATR